jgi:ankyrin repeat protein
MLQHKRTPSVYLGFTVMHAAAETTNRNSLDIMKVFHRNGVDISIRDSMGLTPLHYAIRQQGKVRFLLDNWADLDSTDPSVPTPEEYAANRGQYLIRDMIRAEPARRNSIVEAFMMSQHARLGHRSGLYNLDPNTLREVVEALSTNQM